MPNSLEEITAHSPLPPVPLQAPNALIRRLLARVEVLAVRLAVSHSSTIQSPNIKKRVSSSGYARRERKGVAQAAVGDVLFEFRSRGTRPLGLVVFAELVFGHCV